MTETVIVYEGPIVSRTEAIAAGEKFFFTGKPCCRGHIDRRYIHGSCVACKADQSSRWRQDNLDRHKKLMADWYQENREQQDAKSKAWAKANKANRRRHHANWRAKNVDRVRLTKKLWKQRNPDRVAEHESRKFEKRRTMVKFIITSRMRGRMYDVLRSIGIHKGGRSWREFVPYTADELIARLKKTMPKGYTWDDLLCGRLHVDHIIPIAVFNYTSPDDIDFQRCWALKNLRLLPAKENCAKGAKLDKPFQPSLSGI